MQRLQASSDPDGMPPFRVELRLLPIILTYTAWNYWVFRGKVSAASGYHKHCRALPLPPHRLLAMAAMLRFDGSMICQIAIDSGRTAKQERF
jgi:hypothetical protein